MTDAASPRVIAPESAGADEDGHQHSLRPKTLSEFVGQGPIKQRLDIALQAARLRGEPLDHVLFSGPPGLGKTSLAQIISRETKGKLTTTSGPALEKVSDLLGMLTRLEAGAIFFIDEIHRMPRTVEEYLYSAMEDGVVDILTGTGLEAQSVRLTIQPFTLIGATTRKAMLSAPLRDRFGLNFEMVLYEPDELRLIIERSARLLNEEIDEGAAEELAIRARGTPRIANRLLRRTRDFALVQGLSVITQEAVEMSMAIEGIDALGLDELDRRYLQTLIHNYGGGPAGVAAIAAAMQQEPDTLSDVIEPHLLHIGVILRTPAGRCAAEVAYDILGMGRPRLKAVS